MIARTKSSQPTDLAALAEGQRRAGNKTLQRAQNSPGLSLSHGGNHADQLDIMVTVACNARCAFCVQEATFKSPHTDDVVFTLALRRHMADFYAQGGRRVILTGGEPLLVLPRVLVALKELQPYADLEVKALYTNGSRLLDRLAGARSRTVAQELAAAGLGCVNLSVHHDDEDRNRRLLVLPRRPSNAQLAAHLGECGLPLRLNLTLQKGGIDTAESLARYVRWGFQLGAESIYIRELFRYSFDRNMCASGRNPVDYSRAHAVRASDMIEGLIATGDYRHCGDRREALRAKRECELEFLPVGRRVFLSSLEIGTEAARGYPYLVLMPDGKLYRGWLGQPHEIPGLDVGSEVGAGI
jgi:pyruvate-formate lyase-activating enzyme